MQPFTLNSLAPQAFQTRTRRADLRYSMDSRPGKTAGALTKPALPAHARFRPALGVAAMMDIILGSSIGAFFALALAYVRFCSYLKQVT